MTSSVEALTRVKVRLVEGLTHSPPMKKLSLD